VANPDVTSLLKAWADGDGTAFEALVPVVHRELHRLARHCMSAERAGHSLQPTALINEAYLRLCAGTPVDWQDRSHFFATFARLMRRVLVDVARSKGRLKRGAGASAVTLDEATTIALEHSPNLVDLDLALQALAQIDPRKSRVVELRFFGGFSVEETAAALGISDETVHRDWRLAKSWLRRELRKDSADGR
jgi:RNA polymerase sigma factor (TIGR02999 family)